MYNNLKLNQLESLPQPIKSGDSCFRLRYDTTINHEDSKTRVTFLQSYAGYLSDVKLLIDDVEIMNSYDLKVYNYLINRFPDFSWDTLNYLGRLSLGHGNKLV